MGVYNEAAMVCPIVDFEGNLNRYQFSNTSVRPSLPKPSSLEYQAQLKANEGLFSRLPGIYTQETSAYQEIEACSITLSDYDGEFGKLSLMN